MLSLSNPVSLARVKYIHQSIIYLLLLKRNEYVPQDQTVKVNKDFDDTHVTETYNLKTLYCGMYLMTYII